jgi:hypothetical protein
MFYINTGNDNVTLDTSSNSNSLTLGGTSGSSTLIAHMEGSRFPKRTISNNPFTIALASTGPGSARRRSYSSKSLVVRRFRCSRRQRSYRRSAEQVH